MNGYEIAAVVGALAWLPQIAAFITSLFRRTKLSVIVQRQPQVGFTYLGPIFNLRMAFSASKKDIVISNVQFNIKHETGDVHVFSWQGMIQHFGQMKVSDTNTIDYDREQGVLALKILTTGIEERLVRFQNEKINEERQQFINRANKKMEFMKSTGKYDPKAFMSSEEISDLVNYCKKSNIWKVGKYTATLHVQSQESFILTNSEFFFELTSLDLEALERNKEHIFTAVENDVRNGNDDYKFLEIIWNWRNPAIMLRKSELTSSST